MAKLPTEITNKIENLKHINENEKTIVSFNMKGDCKFFFEDCLKDDIQYAYEKGYLSIDAYTRLNHLIDEYKILKNSQS